LLSSLVVIIDQGHHPKDIYATESENGLAVDLSKSTPPDAEHPVEGNWG
jgi:hypothetical protein